MELIQNKTKEKLIELLREEYPDEDKSKIEKMINKMSVLSLHLIKKFISVKKK